MRQTAFVIGFSLSKNYIVDINSSGSTSITAVGPKIRKCLTERCLYGWHVRIMSIMRGYRIHVQVREERYTFIYTLYGSTFVLSKVLSYESTRTFVCSSASGHVAPFPRRKLKSHNVSHLRGSFYWRRLHPLLQHRKWLKHFQEHMWSQNRSLSLICSVAVGIPFCPSVILI